MNIHFRQLLTFCLVDLLLNHTAYFIWGDSTEKSMGIFFTTFLSPLILSGIMIGNLKNISLPRTIVWISILVFNNCFWVIIINVINPLNKTITQLEYQDGITRDIF